MNNSKHIGKMALATRLKFLSETLMENAHNIYAAYEVPLKPKWFPVFYVVSNNANISIGNIAQAIGQSHPAVIKTVKELKEASIVKAAPDRTDARKTNISLTDHGKNLAEKIQDQYTDITAAVDELLSKQTYDIWKSLDELEYLLTQRSMFKRVMDQRKEREEQFIEIIPYEEKYKAVFRDLNMAWIKEHFVVEEADLSALNHPEEYILEKGGQILIALYKGQAAGVCALIKMNDQKYELAKMAVSPTFKGKGMGYVLAKASLELAKSLGAQSVYLESNTRLVPAISLYRKLGFEKVQGEVSPYERCNIQMEIKI